MGELVRVDGRGQRPTGGIVERREEELAVYCNEPANSAAPNLHRQTLRMGSARKREISRETGTERTTQSVVNDASRPPQEATNILAKSAKAAGEGWRKKTEGGGGQVDDSRRNTENAAQSRAGQIGVAFR